MSIIVAPSLAIEKGSATMLRAGVSLATLSLMLIPVPAYAQDAPDQTSPAATTGGAGQATTSAPSDDPTATDEDAGSIIVTGIRASLQGSRDRKKNAEQVIDSITAQDIGALPDRSVSEALQRIPGITLQRTNENRDPARLSAEGGGVFIRGLSFVRSELNGRDVFSANNGRGLSFEDVSSDLLAGVDVYKNPSAELVEGGIGGIVNLRTRKPFDTSGTYLAGTLENNYGDFVRKSAPTASIVGSTRWKTGIGDIGVLGSFVYSQLFTRSDRLQLSSFRNRPIYSNGTRTDVVPFTGATQNGQGLFPRGAVMGSDDRNRERYGYAGALQWRSNDGSMEAAFQFLRSDARLAWTENVIEIATDNVTAAGDSRARAGTSVSFDEDRIFDQGLITGPTGWRADQGVAPGAGAAQAGRRTPAFGLQSNNQFREHLERSVTDDYGFNFKWDVSDRLGLVVDYSHIESRGEVVDNTTWTTTYQDAFIDLNGKDLPEVRFVPPQSCDTSITNAQGVCQGTPGSNGNFPTYFTGTHQSYTDPYNTFWRNNMDHVEESEGNSDAFRIDADYSFPDGNFLKSVRAGYRYANRDQIARNSTYNWGVLSEQWGNGGPVWLDEQTGGVGGDQLGTVSQAGNYAPYFWSNFFRGQAVNPAQGQGRLFYSGRPASDYASYIAFGKAIRDEWLAPGSVPTGGSTGWVPLAERPGVIPGTYYLPGEVNPIEETNHAGYVMARFDTEFGNRMRFSGNVGLRYSNTKRVSSGFIQFPTTDPLTPDATCRTTIQQIVNPQPGQTAPTTAQVPAGCAFLYSNPQARANARAFANAASVANDVNTNYDYWLPAVNLKLEVGDRLQFRAAYFKGISPPNTRDIRNYFPVSIGAQVPLNAVLTVTPNTATADPNDGIIQGESQVVIEGRGVRGGAPDLLPVTSDNFDLTAEWYFNKVGSLTLSAFYKEVKGVVVFNTQRQSFTNAGQTFDVITTRELNSPDTGKVKGVELAYQQTYDFLPGPLAGLGLQANYTFVDSSGVPQPTLAAGDPAVVASLVSNIDVRGLGLQGLSRHNFNVTPFYDYKGFSIRASYAWRSRYLLTTRDVITPFDPVLQESYGQLDGSVFMQVNRNLRLGIQGVNLTSSITKTSVAVQGPGGTDDIRIIPRGWFINDRRFSAIVRFNF